jgi:hypothetical protein
VIINLIAAVVLTVIFRAAKVPQGGDETLPHQYTADPGEAAGPAPASVGPAPRKWPAKYPGGGAEPRQLRPAPGSGRVSRGGAVLFMIKLIAILIT